MSVAIAETASWLVELASAGWMFWATSAIASRRICSVEQKSVWAVLDLVGDAEAPGLAELGCRRCRGPD